MSRHPVPDIHFFYFVYSDFCPYCNLDDIAQSLFTSMNHVIKEGGGELDGESERVIISMDLMYKSKYRSPIIVVSLNMTDIIHHDICCHLLIKTVLLNGNCRLITVRHRVTEYTEYLLFTRVINKQ